MNDRVAMGKDARWLLSDGQIIGKTTFAPHAHGVLMTLEIPEDDTPLQVAFKKKDVNSMTQFCEMARGRFNERKAEQEAKAARAANQRMFMEAEPVGDTAGPTEALPVPEASVLLDLSSYASVTDRLAEVSAAYVDSVKRTDALVQEMKKLAKIQEVLSAFEDDGEELPSVHGQEEGEVPIPMDKSPREHEVHAGGEGDTVSEGQIWGLESLPDTQSETSQDGSLQEETDVNPGSSQGVDGNAYPG